MPLGSDLVVPQCLRYYGYLVCYPLILLVHDVAHVGYFLVDLIGQLLSLLEYAFFNLGIQLAQLLIHVLVVLVCSQLYLSYRLGY